MMVEEGSALHQGVNDIHQYPPHTVPKSSTAVSTSKLVRPRSVDDLLEGSAPSGSPTRRGGSKRDPCEPVFEDLAESEVFVGSEDEDYEDEFRPDCQPSSLTLSYHDEPRLPLHAVKEEVEAEEAEEAAMSLQLSFQSSCSPPVLLSSPPGGLFELPPNTSNMFNGDATPPLNSVNIFSGDTLLMSHSVEGVNSLDKGKSVAEAASVMSKSVDVLEEGQLTQETSTSILGAVPHVSATRNNHTISSYHNIDITEGIPSLGDLSCSGVDEGVNLNHSPYSDGSPLSHSLASSVTSNMSLDDTLSSRTDTSSFTDTQDTVVAMVQKNPCSLITYKENQSHTNVRSARAAGGKSSLLPGTVTKSSSLLEPNSRVSEYKRRNPGTVSPRLEGAQRTPSSKSGIASSRNCPRTVDRSSNVEDKKKPLKVPAHDRRTCRSNGSFGSTVSSRSKIAEVDHTKRTKVEHKTDAKDSKLSESRYGTLDRKKTERAAKEQEFESITLGRRKKKIEKEIKIEIPSTWRASDGREVEKYGTLGRRKKVRESGDGREETHGGGLSKESKDTLDTYATLPRRRAREMTAMWREQNLQSTYLDGQQATVPHLHLSTADTTTSTRPLRRSRSIGKGESIRSTISSYASNGGGGGSASISSTSSFIRSTPRPSPRIGLPNSPAPSPRPAMSTQTPRKERTIICMEAAIQTALLGHEVAAAMRALARVRSQGDKLDSRPRVEIVRDYTLQLPPKPTPARCHAQVQVDVGWGACSCSSRNAADYEELQRRLKDELQAKEEVQAELDRTSAKIKDMLASMEGVEKEFNQRCDSLVVLETQLQQTTQCNTRLQDRLAQYETYTNTMRKDLTTCQQRERQLQQQVSELEAESRELAEFMGSEKEALTECLREAEAEAGRLRQLCEDREAQIEHREQEAALLAKMAEERRSEVSALSAELAGLQGRTRDLMVCQGAQVSSAAVTLSNLAVRLTALTGRLVHDYSVTETDLQNIVTPSESDSSASSSATASPEHSRPSPPSARLTCAPRRSPASFIHAVLHALRGGPHVSPRLQQSRDGGRNTPEGSECRDPDKEGGGDGSVSLVDQVSEVDVLLSRFLKVCCVLKNDSDGVLNELQEEGERLSREVRCQQQLIEQQQSDCEALARAEARLQRELAAYRGREKCTGADVRRSLSMDSDTQLPGTGEQRDKQVLSLRQTGGGQELAEDGASPPHRDGSGELLISVLKTLEGIPDVVSSQPCLKHLYNSLKAYTLTSSVSQQQSSNGHDTHSDEVAVTSSENCQSSISSMEDNKVSEARLNGNNTAVVTIDVGDTDVRKIQVESETDSSKCYKKPYDVGSNLNVGSKDVDVGGIDVDRSNGNTSEHTEYSTVKAPEELFDMNANPPSLTPPPPLPDSLPPSSFPSNLQEIECYSSNKISPNMLSPQKVSSPNGLTSPHSPLLQKSPIISVLSPLGDCMGMVLPGVRASQPLFVNTETHL